jgi:IS5 family transposase
MARKMKSQRRQAQYRKRKYLAEPPFAWIKSVMGSRRFSLRGVEKVTAEWSLACLAANLRRMNHLMEWT